MAPLLRPSMAESKAVVTVAALAEVEADTTVITDDEEDKNFGFTRPEMKTEKLAGTIPPYQRHVFICYKNPEAWPFPVHESETDNLAKLFVCGILAREEEIFVKTMVTVCESRQGTGFDEGDVLIFPDMIKYKRLKDSDIHGFVDDVLVNGKSWASGLQEKLTGSHIFVCVHGNCDKRSGVCGPVLVQELNEVIEDRGLKDKVFVSGCSDVGSHKFAGNLVVYGADWEGTVRGHWYGYVTPEDVPDILDQHIGKGEVIERLFRGQLKAAAEVENVAEQKVLQAVNNSGKKSSGSTVGASVSVGIAAATAIIGLSYRFYRSSG